MDLKKGNINDDVYILQDHVELAKDTFKRIYSVTDGYPSHKKRAALGLADILIKEGKYEESKKYLRYVLSREPHNDKAQKLLGELRARSVQP